jgi:hypothetical protein
MMDWGSILSNALPALIGLPILGLLIRRWMTSTLAKDAAEKGALQIKDEIIKQLRQEMRDRDADWGERWDRREKEAFEYRQRVNKELGHIQKFNRDTQSDISKLARAGNVISEQELDTSIYITGMGPLDR